MRKAFAANLALILGINALVKPLYLLGIDLGVQNVLGTVEYGRYATYFSFAFLFGVIYDLGLQNYNAVTLSKSPQLLRERLPVMLSLKLVLSLVFGLVVLLAAYAFGVRGRDLIIVMLAAGYHTVLSLLQLLRTNLGAQEKYRFNSLVSVADKVLLILLLGPLLLAGVGIGPLSPKLLAWLTVETFLAVQILALLITIGLVVVGTKLEPGQRWLRWDMPAIRTLLAATLPYGLILLLATAFSRVDMVMIEYLLTEGLYEAGKYAASYRLLDGFNMIGFMFATLLLPMLSKQVALGESGVLLLRQAAGYMAALGIGFAAWTSFHASGLLEVLYTDARADWGEVLAYLMWSAVGIGLAYVYGSYLLARQRLSVINTAFAVAVVVNITLNWWLIPRYGAAGAAAATVATQLGVALVEFVAVTRIAGRASAGRRWWPLPVYATLVLATAYCSQLASMHLLWSLSLQVVVCLCAGLATGLVANPRELVAKLRNQRT